MAITYTRIPDLSTWKKDSSVAMARRAGDRILTRVDELVGLYNATPQDNDYARNFALADLFWGADHWLKANGFGEGNNNRKPAMQELFRVSASLLCVAFGLSPNAYNVLHMKLEEIFGQELAKEAREKDTKPDSRVKYLDRAEAHKYLLVFSGGKAKQLTWYDEANPYNFKKANSDRWESRRGGFEEGYGGFVMSMGRDIYMGPHQDLIFHHSTYLAGDRILAAGSLLIRDGVVEGIKADSGHYLPTARHFVNLIQTLKMHGVDISNLEVKIYSPQGWVRYKAPDFLAHEGAMAGALRSGTAVQTDHRFNFS